MSHLYKSGGGGKGGGGVSGGTWGVVEAGRRRDTGRVIDRRQHVVEEAPSHLPGRLDNPPRLGPYVRRRSLKVRIKCRALEYISVSTLTPPPL